MNIVHIVISDSFEDREMYANELAYAQKNEFNTTLIVSSNISHKFNSELTLVEIESFGQQSIYKILKLIFLIRKINPDIVHSHGIKATRVINIVKTFTSFKHLTTIHEATKNLKVFDKVDLVIGVSSKVINNLRVKTKVVSNWWSPFYLNNDIKKVNEYALSVGKLEKAKGFDLLIKSWKDINLDLIIVGSGDEYKDLISLISSYKLDNKIKIINEVNHENLVKFYKKASVLLIPSRSEGGPKIALEALNHEVPVLSTDVGYMSKILPKEFLAKPDNINSLAQLMNTYVDQIEFFDQSSIFEYVHHEYSIHKKSMQIKEIYEDLLIRS